MTISLKERYFAHYAPLVCEFIKGVEDLNLMLPGRAPQPFLPLFGAAYERSSLRMAIVGRETMGWACLKSFIEQEKATPGRALEDRLAEFQNRDFVEWGGNRYTFWGFAMMFLAALHGRADWGVMKHGACGEILSSFAWGNANAVEYYDSSPKHMSRKNWELFQRAGERFNELRHLVETLRPRVVVVLWKAMSPASYFVGYDYTQIEEHDGVRHYRIASADLDIFHVPHPTRMKFELLKADHYCARLIAQLFSAKLSVAYPRFVKECDDSQAVIQQLKTSAPPSGRNFDKFHFVEWVAGELTKRESFMSVPMLCALLNELGYRTDRGAEYKCDRRGPYRVISGTYHRLDRAGKSDRAQMVAEAFRRPNFEYAYAT